MADDQTTDASVDPIEEEAPPPPDPPLVDGVTINRIMTVYLRGLHVLKGGHLSAPDAMDHVLGGLKSMDEMRDKGRKMWDQFCSNTLRRTKP
jgi:hypothetical protein